jgi:hypothetical protein
MAAGTQRVPRLSDLPLAEPAGFVAKGAKKAVGEVAEEGVGSGSSYSNPRLNARVFRGTAHGRNLDDIENYRKRTTGFWASSDPKVANSYADPTQWRYPTGPAIIPADIEFKNPLIVNAKGSSWHQVEFEDNIISTEDLKELARNRGYDGLVVRNVVDAFTDTGGNIVADTYLALGKGTVRSANTGEILYTVPSGTIMAAAAAGAALSSADNAEAAAMGTLAGMGVAEAIRAEGIVQEAGLFSRGSKAVKVFRGTQSPKSEGKRSRFWASTDPEVASMYANPSDYTSAAVIPAFAKFSSPLIIDAKGAPWHSIKVRLPGSIAKKTLDTDAIAEFARIHDYDGVIFRNVADAPTENNALTVLSDTFVALKRGTVKSATTGENIFSIPAIAAGLAGGTTFGTGDASAAGRIPKGLIPGRGGFSTTKNLATKNDRFYYELYKDDEKIGELIGFVYPDPNTPDGKAIYIAWAGPPLKQFQDAVNKAIPKGVKGPDFEGQLAEAIAAGKVPKIDAPPGVVQQLRETLRNDFPDAKTVTFNRLTGAHADKGGTTKLREAGAGAAAAGALSEEVEGGTSTIGEIAQFPADLMSFFATGMKADEAIETGKGLIEEGTKQVARLTKPDDEMVDTSGGTQVADAAQARPLQSGEPMPSDSAPLDAAAPEGAGGDRSIVGTFWDKVTSRMAGTDVDDPAPGRRLAEQFSMGIAGGMAGAKVPGPPIVKAGAAILGGTLGVIGGSVARERTMEFLESLGTLPPGSREKHGLSDDELQTLVEGEVLIDLATAGGLQAFKGVSRGTARLFTRPTKASRELSEDAIREGISLMPVQAGGRRLGKAFVNVMGRFPLIAGPLRKAGTRSAEQLQMAYAKLPERIAPIGSISDVHTKVLSEIEDTVVKVNDQFVKKFDDIASRPGVTVGLDNTASAISRFSKDVARITPKAAPGQKGVKLPGRVDELQKFLANSLSPLVSKSGEAADQSIKQADNILSAIDSKIAHFAKKGDVEAVNMLDGLRRGVQADMLTNLKGPNAKAIGDELTVLTAEWGKTVDELFSNAIAKKIGLKPAEGIRAARFAGSRGEIADTIGFVLRSNDPAMVKDLSRILNPQTFKELTASVLNERVRGAFTRGEGGNLVLNPGKFAATMGLDNPQSGRYLQTKAMLEASGGLTMKEVHRLDDIAKAIEGVDIPDVSTFIARRGTIGGLSAVTKALVPTMAFSSGAGAGVASSGISGGVVGGLMIYGGAYGISRAISKPANARLLRRVLDKDATDAVKAAAGFRLMRLVTDDAVLEGDMTRDAAAAVKEGYELFINEVRKVRAENANKSTSP